VLLHEFTEDNFDDLISLDLRACLMMHDAACYITSVALRGNISK
jgi:hypothetical protein